MKTEKTILITVDLEDWFQVENFKKYIQPDEWQYKELRFKENTYNLLELFERKQIKVTFFILGWCAEQNPGLVGEIQKAGHEIASHGYDHKLCQETGSDEFKNDIYKSKCILEDIIGSEVSGYRAPSFSINSQSLKILLSEKFKYDSSYNSFGLNTRYGSIDLSTGWDKKGIAYCNADGFCELPITNIKILNKIIPWGGGGYFRLYPFPLFRAGVSYLLSRDKTYLFYIHPWEIDAGQPRVDKAHPLYKFRHYYGQANCLKKLDSFITFFKDCTFGTCSEYLTNYLSSGSQ